jgi:hypothetical protein
MAMQTGELPGEYRRVEYLQTPGGGTYINSGITMSEDLVFEIDFQLTELMKNKYFMGKYTGTSFYLYIEGDSPGYFQTAFGMPYKNTTLLADTDRHKFVYSFSNGKAIVKNGDDVILDSPIRSMSNQNILVAGAIHPNTIPVKTYSSKMIKNGVVVQNLIPCVRKSDSKPGMYDTVSKTFYTNAGSGEFIVPN